MLFLDLEGPWALWMEMGGGDPTCGSNRARPSGRRRAPRPSEPRGPRAPAPWCLMKRVLLALEQSDDGSGAVAFASRWPGSESRNLLLRWKSGRFSARSRGSGWSSDQTVRSSLKRAKAAGASSGESAIVAVVPQARRESASLIVLPLPHRRPGCGWCRGGGRSASRRSGARGPRRRSPPAPVADPVTYEDYAAVTGLRRHEFAQAYGAGVALLRLRAPGLRASRPDPAAEA